MLDISVISRRSGFPASTLRYYEELGLITSAGRHGLRRIFEPEVLSRLSLISLGQAAGFSLTEIAEMLGTGVTFNIDRSRLGEKVDTLDRKIKELTALRNGMQHVMNCTAPSHMECPTFQRLIRVAVSRHRSKRRRKA